MSDELTHPQEQDDCSAEVKRLNKIVRVLMDRAERSVSMGDSDFRLFQTTVMLEDEVRRRTVELANALESNERVTRQLLESESKFRGLAEQSIVGIVMANQDLHLTYANSKALEVFGYEPSEVPSLVVTDWVCPSERLLIRSFIASVLSGRGPAERVEFRGLKRDGSKMWGEASISLMQVAGRPSLIFVLADITERKRAQAEIEALQSELQEQAIRDPLTGLFNRRYLNEALDRELARARREGYSIGIIMGDIDHFKSVNDQYGHLVGDETIRAVAQAIKTNSREFDIPCRYGGEEFLVVYPRMCLEDARAKAEELRARVADLAICVEATDMRVTMSFGVSSFPDGGAHPDEFLNSADAALYAAKTAGRNRVVVSKTKQARSSVSL